MPDRPGRGRPLTAALLRRLVDQSNLAIQVYHLDDPEDVGSFRLLETNPAAAAQAGITHEEMCSRVGKRFSEMAAPLLRTDVPRRYREVLRSGKPDTLDFAYGYDGYGPTNFRVYAWPLDEGTLVIAFTNVTGEYQTQRQLDEHVAELRRAYDELESSRARQLQVEKLASLGQMSAGVAHEINNPLLVVKGYAARIRELLANDELGERVAVERGLALIERSCARIETIANRMSSYSRQAERAKSRLQANVVITEACELLRPELEGKGIRLTLALCERDPLIDGSEVRLEQLVVNLLLNARDAILERGSMPGLIELSSRSDEASMRLRIRDNGGGMSDEVQRKMFDPFFSTKPPGQGTGLGLSIVHEIVEELGGHIGCESLPGHGTVFTLVVPTAGPSA
jgi:C4-dicarboxylate-specific signal transduction histidine kinase